MYKRKRQAQTEFFFKQNQVRGVDTLLSQACDILRQARLYNSHFLSVVWHIYFYSIVDTYALIFPQWKQEEGESQYENTDEREIADNHAAAIVKPNQPDSKFIVKHLLPKFTFTFQAKWYKRFPLLHDNPCMEGVLCFYCSKDFHSDTSPLTKNSESSFILTSFKN